jgi:very-short-patch-repair endonuclease
LARHLPQLAHANGDLKVAFLRFLEAHQLALPRCNVRLHGILVDAYWPELGLVIELDGKGNHGTGAQRRRDARKSATLRAHGLSVLRLDWHDLHTRADVTLAKLTRAGVQRP